ncbi:hypothetical protein CWB41_04385 [Methylovirgula ligni]|uniref:hypothetical protein n=1 Tax=Methylovirgula ligni TaxID=569860 RepID=UPI000E259260|nr:hypothetical protein [Methylovirgula ligni]QAY95062.1 hypothetical protein CWB41_04385 [Methylovirgula ligni]
MISPQRLKHWENNLGLRVLDKPLSVANLVRELRLYHSADAASAAETFAAGCSIVDTAQRYESVYQAAISEGREALARTDEKAMAQFIETYIRRI